MIVGWMEGYKEGRKEGREGGREGGREEGWKDGWKVDGWKERREEETKIFHFGISSLHC